MDNNTTAIVNAAIKRQGSLYRVAKETKVAYSTAHAWKKGTATPRGENLLKLLKLADLSIHYTKSAIKSLIRALCPRTKNPAAI